MLGLSNEALVHLAQKEKIRRLALRRERIATAILAAAIRPDDLIVPVRSSFIAGAIDFANELIEHLDHIEMQADARIEEFDK